jgi:uncharacterized protein YndB with AHSA1/START domain
LDPIEFRHEVLVEAPVGPTFRACDSAREQLAWVGSLVEVEVDPSTPWGPGARFVQVHEEVLEHEPEERIVMRLTHPDFELHTRLEFEDLGGRTRVSQVTRLELRSLALRLAAPLVRSAVDRRIAEDMERLKALLESR